MTTTTLRLAVPATLQFKDLILRAAALAAKATVTNGQQAPKSQPCSRLAAGLSDPFTAEILSALAELVNNIYEHGYRDTDGSIEVCFTTSPGCLKTDVWEHGESFDLDKVAAPDLCGLPERGMGLFIIRACVDELRYEPGAPNTWSLIKYRSRNAAHARESCTCGDCRAGFGTRSSGNRWQR